MSLVAILLAALGLRLAALGQGYPEFYGHVDEIGVAASIWNFFREGTLRPTEFTYPALYQYLVAAGIWLTGPFVAPDIGTHLRSLIVLSYTDPAWSALVGRLVSALASTATTGVVFVLGLEMSGRRVGLVAAAISAVSLLPVQQAHHALPDSTMALCATLCVFMSWRLFRSGSWRAYIGAGIFAGLVAATKFNGALVALGIVAAHILAATRSHHRASTWLADPRLWTASASAVLTLLATSPYLLLTWDQYLAVASYQVSANAFTMSDTQPWWWIPSGLVAAEWGVGLLMCAGMVFAAMRRDPIDWILLAAWIPSFLYIGSWSRQSLHYLLHFYPLLALAAARMLAAVQQLLNRASRSPKSRNGGFMRAYATPAIASVCIIITASKAVNYDVNMMREDSRRVAGEWIADHLPEGSRIAMTWLPYCPRLDLVDVRQRVAAYFAGDQMASEVVTASWQGKPAYHLVNLEVWRQQPHVPEPYRAYVDLNDPETRRVFSRSWRSLKNLRELGVGDVVLPDAVFQRYLHANPPPDRTAAHFRHRLNAHYFSELTQADGELELMATLSGAGEAGVRGTPIRVYRLLPSGD